MGIRYIFFRIFHILKIKFGWFKYRFPTNVNSKFFVSVTEWRKNSPAYFFDSKEELLKRIDRFNFEFDSDELSKKVKNIKNGKITFFSSTEFNLGKNYNWITNPETGYKFDINKHWSLIDDFSGKAGDIKYVWEKARFTFVYDLIRYDLYSGIDQGKFIFKEINDFIEKNPINQGPNYKCSQEISLRIMNWVFVLYYYKNSKFLTDELFEKVINSIYWQLKHVYNNINFSKIAVRNNHAITETLMLLISNFIFPFIPETKKWSKKGKNRFEKEILYQIYDDGTYLQFSNNYHRVVIQLLTHAIIFSKLYNFEFDHKIYNRAEKSLEFLYNSMDQVSGYLPNYGSNDGALFFKYNSNLYRDYRPQLQALAYALQVEDKFNFNTFTGEDLFWLNLARDSNSETGIKNNGLFSYPAGGYFIIRDSDSMTYIRCGSHKDRPAQADNLHLDIWYKNKNVFIDAGTYKYNTEKELIKYFAGTESHNTVMLGEHDQMLKGSGFIWYYWTKAVKSDLKEFDDRFEFIGEISAFSFISKNIFHKRKVTKFKNKAEWIIEDEIKGNVSMPVNQLWHINPEFVEKVKIECRNIKGEIIEPIKKGGWVSEYYGKKIPVEYIVFSGKINKMITKISIEQ